MSLDKDRIIVECDCGLMFRLTEKEIPKSNKLCKFVPEKDHGSRKKQCFDHVEESKWK